MPYSTATEIEQKHKILHDTFQSGKTKSLAWRKWQLKQFWWLVLDNEQAILKALYDDLHRHEMTSIFADVAYMKEDVVNHLAKIEDWAADEVPEGAGFMFGTLCRARVRKEPLGVALVIGAWNFPILLLLQPVIAAITAGCCCMIKPSEMAPATEALVVDLVGRYLDPEAIQVVTGGPQETTKVLEKRFDQIFYTGNPGVGRIIQKAAAANLTPTVLELGGQCPVIVTKTANVDVAAKRVAFYKFFNAGQICLAPNHVFVDPSVHDEFVQRSAFWINKFISGKGKDQMCHIINDRHFDRIAKLLNNSSGEVVVGGEAGGMTKSTRYFPVTLIKDVTMDDSTMSEEIFGPLLPVIKADVDTACANIKSMEHPLALYIYAHSQSEIDTVLSQTSSGGVTINDCVMHFSVPGAPFGGVGNSGHGSYHGKYGFDTFSHRRTVATIPDYFEYLVGFRYPPHAPNAVSKVPVVSNPGFKRGETMADQVDGRYGWEKTKRSGVKAGKEAAKWAAIVLALAAVDARFGGESNLAGLLRSSRSAVTSFLPARFGGS